MEQKHVLIIIDTRENNATRKKDAVDLITKWKSNPQTKLSYQIAVYPLSVGDVWVCETSEMITIPKKWQMFDTQTKVPSLPEDFFSLPENESDPFSSPTSFPNSKSFPTSTSFPPAPTIIIERKALADLHSSYNDGRYADQKVRLINSEAKSVVLLVEGYEGSLSKLKLSPQEKVSVKKKLLSTFTHCMFRDNIHVYHTQNLHDTFEWVHHLGEEMAQGKLAERSADYLERKKYTDHIKMTKQANLPAERGLELQLASIPRISAKMARAVCDVYPNMYSLCAAYAKLSTEKERENMLKDLTFRGDSGKSQRLNTRSSKIYHYIAGIPYIEPAQQKKDRAAAKKDKNDAKKNKNHVKSNQTSATKKDEIDTTKDEPRLLKKSKKTINL